MKRFLLFGMVLVLMLFLLSSCGVSAEELAEANANLAAAQAETNALRNELSAKEGELQALQSQLSVKDEELRAVQDELSAMENELQAVQVQLEAATKVVAAYNSSADAKARADYVCDGTDDQVQIQAAIDALPPEGGSILLLEGTFIKGDAAGITIPDNVAIKMNPGTSIELAGGINADACVFTNAGYAGNSNIQIEGGRLYGNADNQTTGKQYAIVFENVSGSKVECYIESFRNGDAKLKNSVVDFRNLNYERPGRVLSDCESATGWVLTHATIDSSDSAVGGSSLLLSPVSVQDYARASLSFDTPLDFRFYNLRFRLKIENWSEIATSPLWIATAEESRQIQFTYGAQRYAVEGEWYKVNILLSAWNFSSLEQLKNVKFIRFIVPGNSPGKVRIDQIELVPKYPRPFFTFMFDDGYTGQYTIAPSILARYGYKGTLALSLAHDYRSKYIDPLYHNYGWDIASHSVTHPDMTKLSDSELTHELVDSKKWLIEHGYTRGANFFVFPFHASNGAVANRTRQVYYAWRSLFGMEFNTDYPHALGTLGELDRGIAAIDKAYLYHDWLMLNGHAVGEGQQVEPSVLEGIASYLYELGAVVKNPSEIYPWSKVESDKGG